MQIWDGDLFHRGIKPQRAIILVLSTKPFIAIIQNYRISATINVRFSTFWKGNPWMFTLFSKTTIYNQFVRKSNDWDSKLFALENKKNISKLQFFQTQISHLAVFVFQAIAISPEHCGIDEIIEMFQNWMFRSVWLRMYGYDLVLMTWTAMTVNFSSLIQRILNEGFYEWWTVGITDYVYENEYRCQLFIDIMHIFENATALRRKWLSSFYHSNIFQTSEIRHILNKEYGGEILYDHLTNLDIWNISNILKPGRSDIILDDSDYEAFVEAPGFERRLDVMSWKHLTAALMIKYVHIECWDEMTRNNPICANFDNNNARQQYQVLDALSIHFRLDVVKQFKLSTLKNSKFRSCHFCHKYGFIGEFMVCQCSTHSSEQIVYCSKHCQKLHWIAGHRGECKRFKHHRDDCEICQIFGVKHKH